MDAKTGAAATNNFEPSFDWVHEEECDTLLVYLPGFTREQLRVQLTRTRILKISGARPLGDNKWSSFENDFTLSANCDIKKISAKFEEGILYVRQPKVIVPAAADNKEGDKIPPSETRPPQSQMPPVAEHSPPPQSQMPPVAEHSPPPQSQMPPVAEHSPPPKIVQEQKTTPPHEDNKEDDARSTKETIDGEKSSGGNIGSDDAKKDEKKSGNIIDAELAKKVDGDYDYKLVTTNLATKLKKARAMTMLVLSVLFAVALGIYVSKMGWFARKAEN